MEWSSLLAERYGKEHEKFLRENQPRLYRSLRRSGELEASIHSVGEDAAEQDGFLMSQRMAETREWNYYDRVRELQSHHLSVQEVIRHDLIYQPLPE